MTGPASTNARAPASVDAALRREVAADVFPAIRWAFTLASLGLTASTALSRAQQGRSLDWLQAGVLLAGGTTAWLPVPLRVRAWGLTAGLFASGVLALVRFGPMAGNAMVLTGAIFFAAVFLGRTATAAVTGLALALFASVGVAVSGGHFALLSPSEVTEPATWARAGATFAVILVVMAVGFEDLLGSVTRLTLGNREALRQATAAETSFRQLVEATPELILIHRDGRLLYLNPALRKLVGFEGEVEGLSIVEWVHPDDVPRLEKLARQPGLPGSHQYRLRRLDQQYTEAEFVAIDVEYRGAPARVAVGRDVTERNAVLARLMLSDRLASLGTLAAGVAHELNNPLSFVRANLEYISAELRGGPSGQQPAKVDAELLSAVEEARSGTDRMRLIVRDMRALSRVDDGPRGPVDPRRALEWAASLAMPLLRDRARLEQDVPAGLELQGSEPRLGQVLLNLLVNAAQAIPKGSPSLHLVRVSGRREADRILLEVSDSGPGMPEDVRKRAFEPFFTTKGPGEGTGLGLWVCHNLVGAMGGTIALDSEPGRGARFSISLKADPGT